MKNILCLFLFVILLSCTPKLATHATTDAVANEPTGNMEMAILNYINDYRHAKGLASLQIVDAAAQQAYNHSKEMATGKTAFGHDGFDQRIQAIKQNISAEYIPASAENVAEGQLSAKEVVKGWLNSSGHKRNIEGNYNLTGIGVYKDREGTIYFTQIFLRR